jgi:hypothetical protein
VIAAVGVLFVIGFTMRLLGINGTVGDGSGDSGGSSSQTVTYVVNGSPLATVTYGPAGSSLAGSVPMDTSATLGNAAYYSLSAQLQGSGSVRCEILVGGSVVSSSSASSPYGIASCEITKDVITGLWQNANSGG